VRVGIISLCLAGTLQVFAATPKVDSIFPAGGQRGSEFDVTIAGNLEPWPLVVHCGEPRIRFAPDGEKQGKFRVSIDVGVDPGAYLLWFMNDDGVTAPRQFVVGEDPERSEDGADALTIPASELPLTLNGKLESAGEVDRFLIELDAGQSLVASVVAYAIDSPLDPLLHLRGPAGERLAFNHDATRLGLDPRLVFTAPAHGQYELLLSAFAHPPQANIRFAGGATSIYRLSLGHGVPAIDLPPPMEAAGEELQQVAIPSALSGRIDPPGDVDRFEFAAKKGDLLKLGVHGAQLGSWMDPLLVIEDSTGKELARHDDIDSKTQPDAALDWTAPGDGNYVARVTDLNGAGGSEIAYRFSIARAGPGFSGSAATGVFAVRAGEKLELAVSAARQHGYTGELELGIDGLPAAVTAAPAAVPEKGGEVKLSIEAGADAAPGHAPISIWVAKKGAAPEERVPCQFVLKGAFADAGDLLVNQTERGWLSILEKADEPTKVDGK